MPLRSGTPGHRLRALKAFWPVSGFIAGFGLTYWLLPGGVSAEIANYLSVAVLAGLDAVFGGIRAGVEKRFRSDVFISGFLVNMPLAAGLVWLGSVIGVELYLAAVVTFGWRIFTNLSVIRRHLLERHPARAEK